VDTDGDTLTAPALSESLLASPVLADDQAAATLPSAFALDAIRAAAPATEAAPPAALPVSDDFSKQPLPMRRTDSTPSLMSRQLSAWSDMDDKSELAMPAERLRSHHRRARSEGVGFQSVRLAIHLPPLPDSASAEPLVVSISVPAFYTAKQTIVSALHECRRRLPYAAWHTLDQRMLELRLMQDDEPRPQFDIPALATGTLVASVGETELALCTRGDEQAWMIQRPTDVTSASEVVPTLVSPSEKSELKEGATVADMTPARDGSRHARSSGQDWCALQ